MGGRAQSPLCGGMTHTRRSARNGRREDRRRGGAARHVRHVRNLRGAVRPRGRHPNRRRRWRGPGLAGQLCVAVAARGGGRQQHSRLPVGTRSARVRARVSDVLVREVTCRFVSNHSNHVDDCPSVVGIKNCLCVRACMSSFSFGRALLDIAFRLPRSP